MYIFSVFLKKYLNHNDTHYTQIFHSINFYKQLKTFQHLIFFNHLVHSIPFQNLHLVVRLDNFYILYKFFSEAYIQICGVVSLLPGSASTWLPKDPGAKGLKYVHIFLYINESSLFIHDYTECNDFLANGLIKHLN